MNINSSTIRGPVVLAIALVCAPLYAADAKSTENDPWIGGTIAFHAAANAANDDASEFGDHIYGTGGTINAC